MLLPRSVADKIDRQLTHRGAARSVTGLAAMLAHEIKNPLSGIRGAAQLLETDADEDDRALTRLIRDEADRIVELVDRMEVFADERPTEREPVNIHVVLDRVKVLARNGFARNIRIVEEYDPSLPPVHGNRDQLIQVFLNLVKNAAEALGGTQRRRDRLPHRLRPGHPALGAGQPQPGEPAARVLASSTTARACRRTCCRPLRSVRHHRRPTAPASAWRWSPRSSATMAA